MEFSESIILQALLNLIEDKTPAKTFISDTLGETYIYQLKVRYENKAIGKLHVRAYFLSVILLSVIFVQMPLVTL